MKRPSGFSAWRIWIRAPTTSLVQCRPSVEDRHVQAGRREGKLLLVEDHARAAATGQHGGRQVGLDQQPDPVRRIAGGQGFAKSAAARREVDGYAEVPHDRFQAPGDVLGGAPVQEIGRGIVPGGAVEPLAVQGSVEEAGWS